MTSRTQLVVLDDDPTGIQTVHGCYLLTDWKPETLRRAMADEYPLFYVLTNTRAYTRERAEAIIGEIANGVLRINGEFGHRLIFISRSDSTLRNHFPVEVNVIVEKVEADEGRAVDAIFMTPAFVECGRVTVGDTHYIIEGSRRIPTHETEFAKDSVFGYSTAVLPDYIEEKTAGAVRAADVRSIPLELLRDSRRDQLDAFLSALSNRTHVVVNIENYDDLNRFAQAVHTQVERGKQFVFQSAASLVKALSGIPDKPLLGREILRGTGPGLFIAGSHVKKTTAQLERLLEAPSAQAIEIDVSEVLKSGALLFERTHRAIAAIWSQGKTPVIYTSRTELQFDTKESRLEAGEAISRFLVDLVRGLPATPSYIVAKGGITSHNILVQALEVTRVRVLGQVLPGVPAIITPADSRFPNMPYVIFPGNVGNENSLRKVFEVFGGS